MNDTENYISSNLIKDANNINTKEDLKHFITVNLNKLSNPNSIEASIVNLSKILFISKNHENKLLLILSMINERLNYYLQTKDISTRRECLKILPMFTMHKSIREINVSFLSKILTVLQSQINEESKLLFTNISNVYTEMIENVFLNCEEKYGDGIWVGRVSNEEEEETYTNLLKIFELFQGFCIYNIKKDEKPNHIVGSLSLQNLIKCCPLILHKSYLTYVWNNIILHLDKTNFYSKNELLSCLISLIVACEENFSFLAYKTIYKVLDFLNDEDWIKRKLGLNVIYTLGTFCMEDIAELKDHIISFIKVLKNDKYKEVREITIQTLKLFNEKEDICCISNHNINDFNKNHKSEIIDTNNYKSEKSIEKLKEVYGLNDDNFQSNNSDSVNNRQVLTFNKGKVTKISNNDKEYDPRPHLKTHITMNQISKKNIKTKENDQSIDQHEFNNIKTNKDNFSNIIVNNNDNNNSQYHNIVGDDAFEISENNLLENLNNLNINLNDRIDKINHINKKPNVKEKNNIVNFKKEKSNKNIRPGKLNIEKVKEDDKQLLTQTFKPKIYTDKNNFYNTTDFVVEKKEVKVNVNKNANNEKNSNPQPRRNPNQLFKREIQQRKIKDVSKLKKIKNSNEKDVSKIKKDDNHQFINKKMIIKENPNYSIFKTRANVNFFENIHFNDNMDIEIRFKERDKKIEEQLNALNKELEKNNQNKKNSKHEDSRNAKDDDLVNMKSEDYQTLNDPRKLLISSGRDSAQSSKKQSKSKSKSKSKENNFRKATNEDDSKQEISNLKLFTNSGVSSNNEAYVKDVKKSFKNNNKNIIEEKESNKIETDELQENNNELIHNFASKNIKTKINDSQVPLEYSNDATMSSNLLISSQNNNLQVNSKNYENDINLNINNPFFSSLNENNKINNKDKCNFCSKQDKNLREKLINLKIRQEKLIQKMDTMIKFKKPCTMHNDTITNIIQSDNLKNEESIKPQHININNNNSEKDDFTFINKVIDIDLNKTSNTNLTRKKSPNNKEKPNIHSLIENIKVNENISQNSNNSKDSKLNKESKKQSSHLFTQEIEETQIKRPSIDNKNDHQNTNEKNAKQITYNNYSNRSASPQAYELSKVLNLLKSNKCDEAVEIVNNNFNSDPNLFIRFIEKLSK